MATLNLLILKIILFVYKLIIIFSLFLIFSFSFHFESYGEEINVIEQSESKNILFENPQIITGFGNEINPVVGKKVNFSALIKNLESDELNFTFAAIIKNYRGEIEHESWFVGNLNPKQSIEPLISTWYVPSYGDYTVSLELWNNPVDRELLVDPFTIPISIEKIIESNNDVTPPEILIPSNIYRIINNPDGSLIQFHATAYDDVDSFSFASCSPPSDSLFSFGETTVVCTSTDSSGNISEKSFTVTLEYQEFKQLTKLKKLANEWSKNKLNNSFFSSAIDFMVYEKMLISPNIEYSKKITNCDHEKFSPLDSCEIPLWVKNIAQWWSEDKISDMQFFHILEYLIEKKFLVTQHSNYFENIVSNNDLITNKKIIPYSNFAVAGDFGINAATEDTIRNIHVHQPELVLIPGDINHYEIPAWRYSTIPFNSFKSALPAIGNHELDRRYTSENWLSAYGINSDFYAQKHENVLFISLSTEGSVLPQSNQMKFLETSLKYSQNDPEIDWVIVYFHRPIYSDGKNPTLIVLRNMLQPIFDKYEVDLVLQGHNHVYERSIPLKFDSVPDPNGQVYVTIGTGGFSHEPFIKKSEWSLFQNNLDFGFLHLQLILDGQKIKGDFISNSGKILDSFELCSSKIYENIVSYEELKKKDLMCSDLSNVNLSGKDLTGINLAGANLSGANLEDVNLSGLNLHWSNLSNTDLSGKDLTGTNLQGANLSGANLEDVDLSGKDLTAVNLSNTDLSGKDLTGSILLSGSAFKSNFTNVIFDENSLHLQLQHSNLSGADFSNIPTIERKDFRYVDFSNVNFSDKNFRYDNFKFANLNGVSFENSILFGITFNRANLENTNFSNAVITDTNFLNANLKNAIMVNSTIKNSNFKNVNLENTNFSNAEISDSKLNCINHSICD